MGVKIDLTGLKIGKLRVIREGLPKVTNTGRKYVMWDCLCECGATTSVRSSALKKGKYSTYSCGCLKNDPTIGGRTTHNMTRSPTYVSWSAMIKRCTNVNDPSYKNYGGRGIKVCKGWLTSFETFLKDMGERPKNKTIDRRNNNKNYTASNCIWSTKTEQQRNRRKRKNTLSTFRGVSWCSFYEHFIAHVNGVNIVKCDFEEEAAEAYDNFVIVNKLTNPTNNVSDYSEGYFDGKTV